jgi:hypothetical protein
MATLKGMSPMLYPLLCPFDNLYQTPVLFLAQRPAFHNLYAISDLAGILFVMGFQLGCALYGFAVKLVLYSGLYCNNYGFIHFIAYDPADTDFTIASCFISHVYSSFSVKPLGLLALFLEEWFLLWQYSFSLLGSAWDFPTVQWLTGIEG